MSDDYDDYGRLSMQMSFLGGPDQRYYDMKMSVGNLHVIATNS